MFLLHFPYNELYMTSLSLNSNIIYPFAFFSTYRVAHNAGTERNLAANQFSVMERVSTLFTKIYGVISGVFLMTNVLGIVSKCREIIYGPAEEVRRKYQSRFTQISLGADLGGELGSAAANILRVVAVASFFSLLGSQFWTYSSLSVVASCFSMVASGCGVVSKIQIIKHIDSLLKCKTSFFKKEYLLQHRQASIFSIALAVGNIAMSVLFSLSVILGSPVVMSLSGAVFLLMIPVLCVAIWQKYQIISGHVKQNECCKVFN